MCAAYVYFTQKKIYAREITRANLYMQIMRTHKSAFIAADRKGLISVLFEGVRSICVYTLFYIYIKVVRRFNSLLHR